MRSGRFALAGLGWLCLLAWLAVFAAGGGKNALDYAARSTTVPLGQDEVLSFSDQRRALWSGWWSAGTGFRLSTSASPDILFRWNGSASSCTLHLQALAMLAKGQQSKSLYAKVNDAPLVGPIQVSANGTYRIDGVGSLGPGINVLTFWLPDAGRVNATDERLLSLGLRSIRLHCATPESVFGGGQAAPSSNPSAG